MSSPRRSLDTDLIHAGEPSPRIAGSISLPIFQSSTFETEDASSYTDVRYLRMNNTPNHLALHEKVAAIEGAEAGLVTASGMAAISMALLATLRPGDHIAVQKGVYGGTFSLLTEDLAELNVEVSFFDAGDLASAEACLRPSTKVLYCETVTNPLLRIADLPGLAALAKRHGLVSIVDSTFASPVNAQPVQWGFDLVLHSATKHLAGHSDVVAGVVAGRKALIDRVLRKLNHFGGCLDPHACFLLHRGLKTLAVRMRHVNASAQVLAEGLEQHAAVRSVAYPGLASHPDHTRAKELLSGFGGMISLELEGGAEAAVALMSKLQLAANAPSLGGPETLITRPCETTHKGVDPRERRAQGIHDSLVRVSVGLEDSADLLADFRQALEPLEP